MEKAILWTRLKLMMDLFIKNTQFPFSRSHSTYVGTDRRIGDHFGRPIYFECKKTSQCTLACDNCNSCSALQCEYLMSSRCVTYLLFASEPNTYAVPACVFLSSSEVVEDELLVWEGASVCLVRVWRRWQRWSRSHGRAKIAVLTARGELRLQWESECSQQACTFVLLCCHGHFPVRFSTSREQIPKRAHTVWPCVFFKMSFRPCATGCGHYLAPGDGHDYCLKCLGLAHAEVALMDCTCSHCGNMTISVLRLRLQYLEETGAPTYIPRSSSSSGPAQKKPTSVNNLVDLRVTVRNTPPNQSPRAPHSSMTLQPVELPRRHADPPRAVPVVTFGASPEDKMSIATSEGERMSSGDEDSAAPFGCGSVETQRWLLCFPGPPWASGSSGTLHRVLSPRGWTIGFLGWPVLLLSAPPQYLSFQKCMRKWLNRGQYLFTARSRSGPSSSLTTLDGG